MTSSPKEHAIRVEQNDDSGVDLESGNARQGEVSPSKRVTKPRYDGVNPEVEAELQKVIDELQTKGVEKIQVAD